MLDREPGREWAEIAADGGGASCCSAGPLGEPLLMWWNFVARMPGEIAVAVADWEADRFGSADGYRGERLAAGGGGQKRAIIGLNVMPKTFCP